MSQQERDFIRIPINNPAAHKTPPMLSMQVLYVADSRMLCSQNFLGGGTMLIALAIFCAAAGTALLVAAAVLQFRLVAPPAPLHTLARSLAPFNLSFPERFITPDQSHIIALDRKSVV